LQAEGDKMDKKMAIDKFKSKCVYNKKTDCVEGLGSCDKHDYALFVWRGKRYRAARWLYGYLNGPIPQRYDASHFCHNKKCVRAHPEHVISESHKENINRSVELEKWAGEKTVR
jgi:hypothetical protein